MTDLVRAVERAYVISATGGAVPGSDLRGRALAAIGAVASRYLAVGTPRTLGLVIASGSDVHLAKLSIEAHATWFRPRELRCAVLDGSPPGDLPATPLSEALASDIVCVHAPLALRAAELRRGTHVNLLAPATLDDDLAKLATIVHEVPGLGALAAGLVDGRQLDELTVFVAGGAEIAIAAAARATT